MSNPRCCGFDSRWVENIAGKGYFYCGECKKEVVEKKEEGSSDDTGHVFPVGLDTCLYCGFSAHAIAFDPGHSFNVCGPRVPKITVLSARLPAPIPYSFTGITLAPLPPEPALKSEMVRVYRSRVTPSGAMYFEEVVS